MYSQSHVTHFKSIGAVSSQITVAQFCFWHLCMNLTIVAAIANSTCSINCFTKYELKIVFEEAFRQHLASKTKSPIYLLLYLCY